VAARAVLRKFGTNRHQNPHTGTEIPELSPELFAARSRGRAMTDSARASVVYIVQIDKHLKIGFSTNLKSRLRQFRNAASVIKLLLAIPGDRTLEKRLQSLFFQDRIARELFRDSGRAQHFVDHVKYGGLQRGLDFLESITPQKIADATRAERERRVRENRMNKAQLDAYYASLVAERKQRLGW
jgi:hypothetical protein